MKIQNLHTKDMREVEDLKVVTYEEFDKSGKARNNKYVQYTIVSARPWTDFMPVKQFKKLNPDVEVIGLN